MSLERLVLWRHGETDYNRAGRLQGHLDSELTETGLEQAKRAATVVAEYCPDVVVSSDLRRARVTAAALTEVSGVEASIDQRLRETDIGQWQGLSGAEVEHHWPGAMLTWRTDPRWAPPGGEARVHVAERAARVVQELDRAHSGTALLCAHGGVIGALTSQLLELPVHLWPGLGGIANCHWAVLVRIGRQERRWRLAAYNTGALPQ
ncbi:histidine phosphatase family protein [Salinifilum aidingensis]